MSKCPICKKESNPKYYSCIHDWLGIGIELEGKF